MLIEAESSHRAIPQAADAERTGEWGVALTQYESALLSANTRGDFPRAADLLRAIGRLHFERGDYRRALDVFGQSLTQAETTGNPAQTGAALN